MARILRPRLALLASATRQDLARQVAYLKEENRILRSRLPERLVATEQEKRHLLKVGLRLGVQLRELISIVKYQTFVRWVREYCASISVDRALDQTGLRPLSETRTQEWVTFTTCTKRKVTIGRRIAADASKKYRRLSTRTRWVSGGCKIAPLRRISGGQQTFPLTFNTP